MEALGFTVSGRCAEGMNFCVQYHVAALLLFIAIGTAVLGYGAWLALKNKPREGLPYLMVGAAFIVSMVMVN